MDNATEYDVRSTVHRVGLHGLLPPEYQQQVHSLEPQGYPEKKEVLSVVF